MIIIKQKPHGDMKIGFHAFVSLWAFFALTLFLPSQSFAEGIGGIEKFRNGLRALEENKYNAAIANFVGAYEKLPIIGDYALLYASKALFDKGDNEKAMEYISKLVSDYPSSHIKQDAEGVIIMDALGREPDKAVALLTSYANTYPEDEEMKFLLAGLLKEWGNEEEAERLFREVYIKAGAQSHQAYEELLNKDLTPDALLSRGFNLIEQKKYGEAEQTLRVALRKSGKDVNEELPKGLGLSLFKQKKYFESALMFLRAEDLYMAAKAFLRAGRVDLFERTLDEMISQEAEGAADLMVANAIEKHDEGKHGEAMEILRKAAILFPENAEKAIWHTGWSYFKFKKYKEAAGVFGELYDTYDSSKYLYWKARSIENNGEDASYLYVSLSGNDYYGCLVQNKSGHANSASFTVEDFESVDPAPMERIDVLIDIGLIDEAIVELELKAEEITTYSSLISVARRLNTLGRHKQAISLLTLVPEELRPDEILYPLSYWQTVRTVSSKYGMDPHLVMSLIREESRFESAALSSAGALGLMQLMPHTARRVAGKIGLSLKGEEQIHDPEVNIKLGTHYLNGLLDEFGSAFPALAAYNAGEHKVREWLNKDIYESYDEFIEDVPYMETRNYVKRIMTTYCNYKRL
jgi:soluble lytic murein transglycosylase